MVKYDGGKPLFTWVHLADLQFRVQSAREWSQRLMHDCLQQELAYFSRQHGNISGILVSGNVAWQGMDYEYLRARSFFASLANNLDISFDDICIVPGNHDVLRLADKRSTCAPTGSDTARRIRTD